ncbi:hypothetical protein CVS27_09325 [Arthrobacter glacialis]|uniref:Uncharacterized protein n=1 Tax=Arthrobacter glacialis TaxID=1664 RepID=A0A2S3ZWC6_ARTGL|nr:hypothetical protein CVS27_09325 [Arthrobacter glacialis]
MGRLFADCYAPRALGSFLRTFTFGHVRQLGVVAPRFLSGLAANTPVVVGMDGDVLVDLDDIIIDIHGLWKQ